MDTFIEAYGSFLLPCLKDFSLFIYIVNSNSSSSTAVKKLLIEVPGDIISDFTNDKVVPLLLNAPSSLISKAQPQNISRNSSFIVNLDDLTDAQDLLSDDMGAWVQSRTTTKFYNVHKNEIGEVQSIAPLKGDFRTSMAYAVYRCPFINASDSTLHKTIINVVLPSESDSEVSIVSPIPRVNHHNLVFVHYYFKGPEHVVTVKPHGNTKNSLVPYLRTYKSTRVQIRNTLKESRCNKNVFFKAETKVGDIESC